MPAMLKPFVYFKCAKILFHCSTMVLTSVISVFANVAISDIYSSLVIDDSLNEISVLFVCCILC